MSKMIHLIMAWKTEARTGEPKVLYCGTDANKASNIANNAPAKWLRVEKAFVHESFKQRRNPKPTPPAKGDAATDHAAGGSPSTTVTLRNIAVPTLQEVLDAGYAESAAQRIVLAQQAKADAVAKNPDISNEELEKIGRDAANNL